MESRGASISETICKRQGMCLSPQQSLPYFKHTSQLKAFRGTYMPQI